jgi:hypothetical protein
MKNLIKANDSFLTKRAVHTRGQPLLLNKIISAGDDKGIKEKEDGG